MLPKDRTLVCTAEVPIVVIGDSTGSMGDSARVVHDKRPLLWGQIEHHGYLADPAMSIAVVGDHTDNQWPFQVSDFENDPAKIDEWMKRCFLEGGGGGTMHESYLEIAFYYSRAVEWKARKGRKGYLFMIGDEAPYAKVTPAVAKKHFGIALDESISAEEVMKELRKRFHVFFLQVPYNGGKDPGATQEVTEAWKPLLSQSVISLTEPNSVVDVMLGLIATIEGVRTLDSYDRDMEERNQTAARRKNVRGAIEAASTALAVRSKGGSASNLPVVVRGKDRRGKGNRLD
jgi:hypothetical protein